MNPPHIYKYLPIPFQILAVNFKGWGIKRHRYNKEFFSMLSEFEDRLSWSSDRIEDFKFSKLKNILDFAYQTVPYYRNIFKTIQFNPSDMKNVEDIKSLPLLTKEIVKKSSEEFISENFFKRDMIKRSTSGTTGAGLVFWVIDEADKAQWATWWRYRRQNGLRFGEWMAEFGQAAIVPPEQKRPPFHRIDYVRKELRLSNNHMSNDNLWYYFEELNKRKIRWIHGYPSSITMMANFMIHNNLSLSKNPDIITCGAENLLLFQVDSIKKAFGVSPIQHYGQEEAVANISQCPYGSLHVDEDFSLVEFIKSGDIDDGYSIVGTTMWNYGMPLIRYQTNDVVILDDKPCECGRWGRIVRQIKGRQEDYVVCSDGTKVSTLNQQFKDFDKIHAAQIYQKEKGEMFLRIVKYDNFTEKDEKGLVNTLRKRFPKDKMDIKIEYVNEIPRTSRGKSKLVVSELEEGKIE